MVSWVIKDMVADASSGGVVSVNWEATVSEQIVVSGTPQSVMASNGGTSTFEPNPSDSGFVPYDDLTEDDVLGWVYLQVDKDAYESDLQQRLQSRKDHLVRHVSGMPWK